jgi:hypothetical protein
VTVLEVTPAVSDSGMILVSIRGMMISRSSSNFMVGGSCNGERVGSAAVLEVKEGRSVLG